MKIITFGTFDLFHIGHLKILERARNYGDYLIVGVSSDELNLKKKNKIPIYSSLERKHILSSIKYVDEVFLEETIDKKQYCLDYKADILVMGDDWKGKRCGTENKTFDEQLEGICKVIYLPRTPSVSTTQIIEKIKYLPL